MAPASTAALGETAAVRPAASSGPVMKATSMITASSAYADWSASASSSIAAQRLRMQEEIGGMVRPESALRAASMATDGSPCATMTRTPRDAALIVAAGSNTRGCPM